MIVQPAWADTLILGFNPGDFIAFASILTGVLMLAVLLGIRSFRDIKQKKRSEQRYREQYINKVYLSDSLLGTIEAEYDVLKRLLTAENADLPAFGNKKPNTITAEGYEMRDDGTVVHSISLAYGREQQILEKLAETVRQELLINGSDPEIIPKISDITEQISMTEFHFTFTKEERIMQMIGGVEIDFETFGVNALYRIDDEKWEYDAERIGG